MMDSEPTLRRAGEAKTNIFDLFGSSENDGTFAIGWLLLKSGAFRRSFLLDLTAGDTVDDTALLIDLQRHVAGGGLTDIELSIPGQLHFIVEAKVGWVYPSDKQLGRYAARILGAERFRRLVSISAASRDHAVRALKPEIGGVPNDHRSWADVQQMAKVALATTGRPAERLWLVEFIRHMERYVSVQNPRDNQVYVVSLNRAPAGDDPGYSFLDVVEADGRYYHPVGNRWPVLPPNYIGFRYDGRLQSVHHVDAYEVTPNPVLVDPRWSDNPTDHFIYTLGPAMKPARVVANGPSVLRSNRVTCAIDTLLSGAFDTITDAWRETNRRNDLAK